jgi:hypothetical protein
VPWPPTTGERLPHASEAFGIREKLAAYCLNTDHPIGGPKAQGFRRILGIDASEIEYLETALRIAILDAPITAVRENSPHGVLCEIRLPVAGLGRHLDRVATVTTSWELRTSDAPPRLVTAYIHS